MKRKEKPIKVSKRNCLLALDFFLYTSLYAAIYSSHYFNLYLYYYCLFPIPLPIEPFPHRLPLVLFKMALVNLPAEMIDYIAQIVCVAVELACLRSYPSQLGLSLGGLDGRIWDSMLSEPLIHAVPALKLTRFSILAL